MFRVVRSATQIDLLGASTAAREASEKARRNSTMRIGAFATPASGPQTFQPGQRDRARRNRLEALRFRRATNTDEGLYGCHNRKDVQA
jgi:hypothetical protein